MQSKKRTVCLLAALLACVLPLCACSAVNSALEGLGLGELGQKMEQAWDEFGRDAWNDMTDDAWREFGFGKLLEWPSEGPGAKLPPLRSGELSAHLDEPTRGFLRVTSLKASDYAAYVDELTELGFAAENGFLQNNGVWVALHYDEPAQALLLFYADSASSLTDLIEHPPSVSEAEDTVAES